MITEITLTGLQSPIRERAKQRLRRTLLIECREQMRTIDHQETQAMPAIPARATHTTGAIRQHVHIRRQGLSLSEDIAQAVLDFCRKFEVEDVYRTALRIQSTRSYPTVILFSDDVYAMLLPILRQEHQWEAGFPVATKGIVIPFSHQSWIDNKEIVCLAEGWL
jgi:hypothetical protein